MNRIYCKSCSYMGVVCYVLLVFGTSCSSLLSGTHPAISPTPTLIVFSGESNSGGQAFNKDAADTELALRSRVQILNNLTFVFEGLDIGTNNNLDHCCYIDTHTQHGWELELANRLYGGTLLKDTIYLVKTGQGGSTISQWDEGGAYYTRFKQRMDSAIQKLTRQYGKNPEIVFFYTQGINDALAATHIEKWKSATLGHFEKIRTRYGSIPIYIPYFMKGFTEYNTAFDQIASGVSWVKMVSSANAELEDAYHWNYAGMKIVAGNLIDAWIQ